jgi:hypothetical protein
VCVCQCVCVCVCVCVCGCVGCEGSRKRIGKVRTILVVYVNYFLFPNTEKTNSIKVYRWSVCSLTVENPQTVVPEAVCRRQSYPELERDCR